MQLVVGRIGRAQGIRGEVTVEVRTDEPERRFAVGSVVLADPAERGPLTVAALRWQSGRLILSFEGVGDRNAADALRGTFLVVGAESLEPLGDPEEFRDHELRGLRVELLDGTLVGVVSDVLHGPAGEILAVKAGLREILIPFVRIVVPVVDIAAGKVVIDPPPGLLELAE